MPDADVTYGFVLPAAVDFAIPVIETQQVEREFLRYMSDALVRRFPERADEVGRLSQENDLFQSICEDYEAAVQAHAYWSSASGSSDERTQEYRRMVIELEAEAAAVLEERAPA